MPSTLELKVLFEFCEHFEINHRLLAVDLEPLKKSGFGRTGKALRLNPHLQSFIIGMCYTEQAYTFGIFIRLSGTCGEILHIQNIGFCMQSISDHPL